MTVPYAARRRQKSVRGIALFFEVQQHRKPFRLFVQKPRQFPEAAAVCLVRRNLSVLIQHDHMVIFLRSNEKARLQATICGSADGLSLWNHSVSVILIFALSYITPFLRSTRAFTFQKAFSAAPSGRFRYALSAKSETVLGNSIDIYRGSYRYLFYQYSYDAEFK